VKTQSLFVSVFGLVLVQACSSSTTAPVPDNCAGTDFIRGGVVVTVVDSASGALIGNGASVTAIDGPYFDAITTPDLPTYAPGPIYVASERAGQYDVYVSRAGYRPWVAYNVLVTLGGCRNVEATNITAKLQSVSSPSSIRSAL
jgi:hypothetical protein